tara:strand:+ start:46 stop:363 length:318 start_codon:yes stop_codon:yes gene_type:complete
MTSNKKLVNINNFCMKVEKFSNENPILDICDENFIFKMVQKGYCFVDVSPTQMRNGLAESRIRLTNGNHKESVRIVDSWLKKCPLCEKVEQEEEDEYKQYTSDSE